MRFIKYFFLTLIIAIPINSFAGTFTQSFSRYSADSSPSEEVYAYYDLRNRNTFIQVTNAVDENPLCIHVQIFQQDQGCTELDFNDSLTINDTVIYDMDNLIRNNGSEVPVNLSDDSYGFVAISAVNCITNADVNNSLIGNFRIIDDSGYEYRMNLIPEDGANIITEPASEPLPALSNLYIPFNTVDGATYSDIVGFIINDDRDLSGNDGVGNENDDKVYNEQVGINFSVFQIDENEQRISCDTVNFACGPEKTMNYGINNDFPNSRGGPLLCEGAGLTSGQTNGYISLENATFSSPLDLNGLSEGTPFQFKCLVGLNNGNGTGSMDKCQQRCIFGTDSGSPGCETEEP